MVAHNHNFAADYATSTSVSLLDALIDAMTLARPGKDASAFPTDITRLGDGAARAAYELDGLLDTPVPAKSPAVRKTSVA